MQAPPLPHTTAHDLAWLAPPAFVFIWSTGYLAAKAAAPHADPLTFLSLRYALVVALMLALALWARAPWPKPRQAALLALTGLGIQGLYLGGVWMAIRLGLSAGAAALIVNLQPVLVALAAPWLGERLSRRQGLGVGLGFAGVLLVVAPKLAGPESAGVGAGVGAGAAALPLALCVLALLGITAGTLVQKRYVPSFDLRTGQVIQFSAALVCTLPLAWALEPMHIAWNAATVGAMAWSVLVLTATGISLMFWMLRHGRATAVTSTMYLVPSVTALLAWGLFGERLGLQALAGMLVSLGGVYLVVKPAHSSP